ncbi:mRNA surveillance protein pelota [Candidatus Woesearchaeota archaeon]|nr:mRNA surveillance protein pelota [Candidatus Woesearchaeota archaeon]
MKILKSNLKKGEVTVQVQTLDDLWYLSQVIEPGDLIKGRTFRKVQVKSKDERASEAAKRPIWVALRAEKVEFHKYSNILRASGMIIEAPDDVPKAHHTFNFEEGTAATIVKDKWFNYQLDRLREAASKKSFHTIICVFDREEAIIAVLQEQGYKVLAEIKGQVEKKAQKTETKNFYREIIGLLKEHDKKYKVEHIILSSPSFWKEELLKELGNDDLKSKIVVATCSSVKGGINETLKRAELKEVLKQERTANEERLVEQLFVEISKAGLAAYGKKEVGQAADAGAVKLLIVTDKLILKARQEDRFAAIEKIMKDTDKSKGDVYIVNSENEPGKKLDALGGIGALLRYRISW